MRLYFKGRTYTRKGVGNEKLDGVSLPDEQFCLALSVQTICTYAQYYERYTHYHPSAAYAEL